MNKKLEVIWIGGFLVIVCGVGLLGVSVKQANHKYDTLEQKVTSLENKQLSASSGSSNSSSNDASTYDVISPFSVKFPSSDSVLGLGYTTVTADKVEFDNENFAQLAQNNDPKNTCYKQFDTLGTLERSPNIPITTATSTSDGSVAHIGQYYYIYSHHTKECSDNANVQAQEKKYESDLITQLKKMSAV